ncbi:large neutral amino acids transporter small subunit 1 [Nilaparvata lugens]|uniref:large neutral amino acids transporter small subunit 1 n=1 Tax=Nilaparvata lugens TaxID=108931 RepID=UPI00193E7FCB|nr:large neutral amino acids transporter small subunit 1 [Nilaparvata lugens]XP_039290059.1 large neutral amino acids transporter small subunit 1 [Nilaparvata lugens]
MTKQVTSPVSDTCLMTPTSDTAPIGDDKVRMKKQLGLLEGVAIILGIIFGSGIFISPKGVIQEVGSVGLSLVVWAMCGVLSMIGALCYAELGTSIPKSGGDYAYIYEAFGPLFAFLYLWDAMLIFVPTTNAIMGLTFAKYVIDPFFPECPLPEVSVRFIAACAICFFTFMNCYNVKLTSNIQNSFMFGKTGALALIIIVGIASFFMNDVNNFDAPFQRSTFSPGPIAVAFYSGIFSYSGWNYLNFMTEELKNPYVNLPRAIYISLPLVTLTYVLANVAYLAVLSPDEMIASNAIAVSFGYRTLGVLSWIMPLMVAMSALGGLSVHIMTSSRMCFVGARYGHFPAMLSHLNINKLTPMPSLVFLNILSLLMLCTSDIHLLITYASFVESFFLLLSVSGLLWLRYKKPNMHRPIKVSLIVPVTFVILCIFLVIFPVFSAPYEVLMGVLITLTGIPAYYFGVVWKEKPSWFTNALDGTTAFVQKLFMSAKEEGVEGFD